MTIQSTPSAPEQAEVERVMGELLTDMAATAGLQATQLGIQTGLWRAMAGAGPLTVEQVAGCADLPVPYVREWLKHQALSGYVEHEPATQRFSLPPAVAAVLAEDPLAGLVDGFARMLAAMATDGGRIVEAYRTGQGLGWHERSAEHWRGMDLVTRAQVVPALVATWIPALHGVAERLRAGGTVADVGCGYGAALVAVAQTYLGARCVGFDCHDPSIARARKAAADAGLLDRVAFEVADATSFPGTGYDLVLFVDALHDLGDPLGALRHARDALHPDGTVLLVEFACEDRLEDNANAMGRLLFAASALVCTPNAVAQGARDPLGSGPGEARLTALAREAGFPRVRRLAVDAPLNLLLELRR